MQKRENNSMLEGSKKQKVSHKSLTGIQKKELCQKFIDSDEKLTQAELKEMYGIGRSTVSEILAKKDKWLNLNENLILASNKRDHSLLFPKTDEATALWFDAAINAGLTVNGILLQEKILSLLRLLRKKGLKHLVDE
ncbi:6767_t:CDS:1 [Acaulospora morrowiae]|uniref:6767_t:CDS:1 n=1 Tax=Acaulospora morrowiae TaxID=94023 RepID=A0A9N9HJY1_9GLOM|nr:6767_t:CDS:1 [Acaulospora morrowiae]